MENASQGRIVKWETNNGQTDDAVFIFVQLWMGQCEEQFKVKIYQKNVSKIKRHDAQLRDTTRRAVKMKLNFCAAPFMRIAYR